MSVQAFLESGFSGSGVSGRAAAAGNIESQILAAPVPKAGEGEPLRHILLGSPGSVRQTIHLLLCAAMRRERTLESTGDYS